MSVDYLKFQIIEEAVEDVTFDIPVCPIFCSYVDLQVHGMMNPCTDQSHL